MDTYPCPIPKITSELGNNWDQPKHSEIQFTTDGFAIVSKRGMRDLAFYNTTFPSGVYAGKMWGRVEDGIEYLCWYQEDHSDLDRCEIKYRKILSQAVLDLIDPPVSAPTSPRQTLKNTFSGLINIGP